MIIWNIQNQIVIVESRRGKKVEVDLSNDAPKSNVTKSTGANALEFSINVDLSSLKSEEDKLDIDKLKTVPIDLIKLSYVVDNDTVKKTIYNELVTKANLILVN